MFRLNTVIKSLSICCISAAGLIACDPEFTTTSQECVSFDPVTLVVPNYDVQAGNPNNAYKLYLEDALNSLDGAYSTTGNTAPQAPSADEQTALDFITGRANLFLGYEIQNGVVTSATNALDFLESLIAATDSNEETIQTFVNAKQNVARAIAKEDSVCNYRNKAIVVREEQILENNPNLIELVSSFNAQLDINYNPFNTGDDNNVDQVILISLNEPIPGTIDDNEDAQKLLKSFNGFQRVSSSDFNAIGVSPPEVRQLTVTDFDSNETFFFDDDFDTLKLGQIVSTRFNKVCRDDDNEAITCPENTTTRNPEHEACKGDEALRQWLQGKCPITPTNPRDRHPACPSDGGPAEEAVGSDDTGQVQINHITVVEDFAPLTDVQRLRLEVDYQNSEIRLYASKYAEAILRAEATLLDEYNPDTDVIFNPTRCEQQAVLDDLAYQERDNPDFDGVRLTLIEDPNYDVIETSDENDVVTTTEPTPIFTFQAVNIPEARQ